MRITTTYTATLRTLFCATGEPQDYAAEITVDEAAGELLVQIRNASSALFAGDVTVAVDPTWGLSGEGGVPREHSPHLPHQVGV